jgi:Tol biopolymer transport system component
MKRITLVSVTICLISVILPGISAPTLADIASDTNTKAGQHFVKANELLKHMDYEAAIAEYSKVVDLSSGSKIAQDAQYWIGQSHFRAGQYEAAQATFAKLIEAYPTSAIVPVTKLMVERVEQAKANKEKRRVMSAAADKGFIIDPDTGVRYTKTVAFAGKNDVIEDITYNNRLDLFQLSPNGKFILYVRLVVPLDGSEPFDLVDMSAERCVWSPDGRNVAFYSEDGIYMVPVSPETARRTGPARKLLDGRYTWGLVSWSPDGEKLAFRRTSDENNDISGGDIWTISVKDGSLTQITSDPAHKFGPAWSPDGKTIVYAIRKDSLSFWLISAEGGVPRKIIEPGGRCIPFWSPDGKWILYTLGGQIHLFGLNDNQELEIIPPGDVVGDFFSWSPDGGKMLFYRPSYDYKYGLKVVSAFGGPPFDLGRHLTLYAWSLAWSDNNKIITKGENKKHNNIVFWIIPLSGGDPVLLDMDVSVDASPSPFAVSPNVKKLAFTVGRDDGTRDLFAVPISLQDARTVGPAIEMLDSWHAAPGMPASWSPDGNKFAVIHRGDLWIAFSNGDKPVQITKTPELEHGRLGWSPDGRMIHYIVRHSQTARTSYVVSASDGKTTKILDTGPGRIHAWSPDSKKLAIESEGLISVVSTADSGTQQIAKLKDLGLDRIFDLRWSPDGKYFACVGNHIKKGPSGPILVIPVEGGKVTTLTTDDTSEKYRLFWSSDGKWISYNSEGSVKVRPEGTMWEADFEEIVKKASR